MSSIEKGERPVPPTLKDIEEAAVRIKDYAARTPLLESPELNELVGGRLLFKPEVLQRTASFKFRGACNRLLQLSAKQQRAGVVAFSSGNHALATSAVGRILNIPATIIMPSDAPQAKIKGARANGATVILYDRQRMTVKLSALKLRTAPAPPWFRPTTIHLSSPARAPSDWRSWKTLSIWASKPTAS